MRPRHKLEDLLAEDIENGYNDRANAYIDLMLQPQPLEELHSPSIDSFDEFGKSFLYIALSSGNQTIASRLMSLQKNNDRIIFAKSWRKATLFHVAAQAGFVGIFDELVASAKALREKNPDYKYWLHLDANLNTCLFWALYSSSDQVAKKIISLISLEENAALIVNHVNALGGTPLYYASKLSDKRMVDGEIINLLMNLGADFTLSSGVDNSPILGFRQLSIDLQIAVFNKLEKKNQRIVLDCYQSLLTASSDNADKNAYFALSRLHSLQAELIARLEWDTTIPLKEHYNGFVKEFDENNNAVYTPEKFPILKEDIAERLPLYSDRLFHHIAMKKIESSKESLLVDESNSDDDIEYNNRVRAEVVEHNNRTRTEAVVSNHRNQVQHDLKMLTYLITMIENYLPSIQTRNPSVTSKTLAVSIPVSFSLLFVGLCVLFGYKSNTGHNNHYVRRPGHAFTVLNHTGVYDCNKSESWPSNWEWHANCEMVDDGPWLLFGVLAFFAACMALCGTITIACKASPLLWNKEPTISHDEWRPALDLLEAIVLKRLYALDGDNKKRHTLVTERLTESVAMLKQDRSKWKAATYLTSVLDTLNRLRDAIKKSDVPIQLPQLEVTIEMEAVDNESADAPLLAPKMRGRV